jgi:prepilin-type N-terminal cleavage/methylation domain-containing protein/prepilin-type processing-associated H-X9-DG protein
MSRRAHAFTLIELLVVISIIALLIGILLPALQRARNSARDVVGLSNQRQFATALFTYATDHKDKLPRGLYSEQDPPGSGQYSQADWMVELSGYLAGGGDTYQSRDSEPLEVFQCPRVSIGGTKHYSAHPVLMPDTSDGKEPDKPYKLSAVQRPTEVIGIMDGTLNPDNNTDAAATAFNLYGWQDYMNNPSKWELQNDATDDEPIFDDVNEDAGNWSWGYIRWRHGSNDAGNFMYMDGHASTEKQGTVTNRSIRLNR